MTSPIIVAIDRPDLPSALSLADVLDPALCRLKVGKELFTACGTDIVKQLHKRGFEIFLDLKFHDIPNTTTQAVKSAADLGVWMTNVHASCGLGTMKQCQQMLNEGDYATKLIAVTVLTSMTDEDLSELGINRTASEQVLHLAQLTHTAGLFGVVCSAQESTMLKAKFGKDFHLVTPGIRMHEDSMDDQARICTPKQAMDNGSDFLVIGRSITGADKPNDKLTQILHSINP